MTERPPSDPSIVISVFIDTFSVVLFVCSCVPKHEGAAHEQYQQVCESSQGDHSHLQLPDNGVSVLDLNNVLDHSLMVHFALHCLHCFTSVKASIIIGGYDDKALAKHSVLKTGRADTAREEPADWKVGLRGTWEELHCSDVEAYNGRFH